MEFDLENPLTDFQSDHNTTISSLFLSESDQHFFIPNNNNVTDFYINLRQETISYIVQCSSNLDPFVTYLAINYLDRFLSTHKFSKSKPWVCKLIAISCVTLAAKMKKTDYPVSDFNNEGFIFDNQTIERMEYVILNNLKWRMRSITPFCFISMFISKFKLNDQQLNQALKDKAVEIIFKLQNDINFLWFKPSIIASSALLCASHQLFPMRFYCFNKAILNCSYINKEKLSQCYKLMQETNNYQSKYDTSSSLDTPVNVLDENFSSSQSDGTMNMIISSSSSTTSVRNERW